MGHEWEIAIEQGTVLKLAKIASEIGIYEAKQPDEV